MSQTMMKGSGIPGVDAPGFKWRRTQNWMLLGLLYAFFYMTRYNFSAINVQLAEVFGWTNTDLGVFETVLPLVYGLAVFLNGPLADRLGGKKVFLIGAGGVVVMNFLFGLGSVFIDSAAVWTGEGAAKAVATPAALKFGMTGGTFLAMMVVVWGVNGYFQSFGALSIIKVNAQWFHIRERGTFSGVFGVLIRFGLILAFSGSPLILAFLPWQFVFWIPAACVALLFVLNRFFMTDTPKQAGYPDFRTGEESPDDDDEAPAKLTDVLTKVFASRTMWMIALASMMIGFVRRSVVDAWYPKYFADTFGLTGDAIFTFVPYQTAAWGIALAGIAGGFAFGITSDRVFHGRRAPVVAFGFIGMAIMLALFGMAHKMELGPWAVAGCLTLLSFCVNGAHGMVAGAASMDFGGKKAAATAAGLIDGMQYLAGALVGIGVGVLVDKMGWGAWMWAPIPFALLGAVVMATIWNATPRGRAGH